MNNSKLFSLYNKVRHNLSLRTKSVNKAFGLVQSGRDYVAEYNTTLLTCECPDHFYRQLTCKHMLAEQMKVELNR